MLTFKEYQDRTFDWCKRIYSFLTSDGIVVPYYPESVQCCYCSFVNEQQAELWVPLMQDEVCIFRTPLRCKHLGDYTGDYTIFTGREGETRVSASDSPSGLNKGKNVYIWFKEHLPHLVNPRHSWK